MSRHRDRRRFPARALTRVAGPIALAVALAAPPRVVAEPVFPVVDLHVDIPWQVHYRGRPIDLAKGQVTRRAIEAGNVVGIVLPIYLPRSVEHPSPDDLAAVHRTIEKIVWAPGSPFRPELVGAEARPRVRGWLAIEGAEALAGDPSATDAWVARGVRLVGLAHTEDDDLAGSSTGKKRGGLTDRGKEVARRAIDAGALLDVSHLSDAAFDDVAALAKEKGVPFVASHSDARAICDHPRNLTDDELRRLAESGGVVGLNLHAPYVSKKADPGIDDVVAQADRLVAIAGEDHVAIGSDYDGGIRPPAALPDASSFPVLARALLAHGWSEARVRKVFSENALRVLDGRPVP